MNTKRLRFISAFVNVAVICLITALRYSGVLTFKIGNAVPVVVLPVIIAISLFSSNTASLLYALFAGVLMDSMAADSSCFNTLFLVVTATACNLLISRLLNRNIKAAIYLSAIISLVYFFLKYLIFFAFNSISVNYDYFMLYLIPSVLYTAIFIIPFYFLEKKLSN